MKWSRYKDFWNDGVNDIPSAIYRVGTNGDLEREMQYKFMLSEGLKPEHKFMDLGCGCMRGTIDILDYLKDGNFYGLDVSDKLLTVARERINKDGLKNKPDLKNNTDFEFKKYFGDVKFDYILSVSLLTHIYPDDVENLFSSAKGSLNKKGKFYFTIYTLPEESTIDHKGSIGLIRYRKKWLIDNGLKHGLDIIDMPGQMQNDPKRQYKIDDTVNTILGQWTMRATIAV